MLMQTILGEGAERTCHCGWSGRSMQTTTILMRKWLHISAVFRQLLSNMRRLERELYMVHKALEDDQQNPEWVYVLDINLSHIEKILPTETTIVSLTVSVMVRESHFIPLVVQLQVLKLLFYDNGWLSRGNFNHWKLDLPHSTASCRLLVMLSASIHFLMSLVWLDRASNPETCDIGSRRSNLFGHLISWEATSKRHFLYCLTVTL